ncbi:MAG: hypothetical protein ACXABY_14215 [Candidatus Thorarchaeota archaeon]|jgi:hypothetical protein
MKLVKITGYKNVLAGLKKAQRPIGAGLSKGLTKAGKYLQRESQKIVPRQTGHLRASAFTRRFGMGLKTDVIVGYTAAYAAFVHENLDAAHGKDFNIKHAAAIQHAKTHGLKAGLVSGGMFNRGENQQAKFLETPAREKRKVLLQIIRSEGKKAFPR